MDTLKSIARSYFPPSVARTARRALNHLRYERQLAACREGFQKCGDQYEHTTLFVAGLPKSGTTWVEKMLCSYAGYGEVMLPEAVRHEALNGGSHNFDMPEDTFERLRNTLAVLKLHVHGSPHNTKLLQKAGLPYLVLYRDVRDVAVSHYFYVRRTPWHPEQDVYRQLNVEEGLLHFGRTLLPAYVEWVRSWHERRDPEKSLVVRYEDLLQDTERVFTDIASLFDLDDSPTAVQAIVDAHSFESMSGGRKQGQKSNASFYRKGVSGDWQNHFTEPVAQLFKRQGEGFWVEQDYETDSNW